MALGCAALQVGSSLTPALALEALAAGAAGKAGAPEKSTKNALLFFCIEQTGSTAAAVGSAADVIGLLLVASLKLTKKA
jgi:hypothetical protein